jgi:hypothetical protein
MLRFSLTTFSIVLFSSIPLLAQPQIKAVFTGTPPEIDGLLIEDVWKKASVINESFQSEPKPGDP